jgi:hypothetical protein
LGLVGGFVSDPGTWLVTEKESYVLSRESLFFFLDIGFSSLLKLLSKAKTEKVL